MSVKSVSSLLGTFLVGAVTPDFRDVSEFSVSPGGGASRVEEGFNEFAESGVSGVTGGGLCSFDSPARGSFRLFGEAALLLANQVEASFVWPRRAGAGIRFYSFERVSGDAAASRFVC